MVLFGVLGVAAKETAIVLPALAASALGRTPRPLAGRVPLAGVRNARRSARSLCSRWESGCTPTTSRRRSAASSPIPWRRSRHSRSGSSERTRSSRSGRRGCWRIIAPTCSRCRSPRSTLRARSRRPASRLIVVAGVVLLLRGAIGGAGLLWFLLALLPVAQIVPYSEVVSEHNAYLPLAGLALAVGNGAAVAYRAAPRAAALVIACLLLALGVRSHDRAVDWADNLTLWRATVAAAPESVRGQFNLGIALLGEGKLLDARGRAREHGRARTRRPRRPARPRDAARPLRRVRARRASSPTGRWRCVATAARSRRSAGCSSGRAMRAGRSPASRRRSRSETAATRRSGDWSVRRSGRSRSGDSPCGISVDALGDRAR